MLDSTEHARQHSTGLNLYLVLLTFTHTQYVQWVNKQWVNNGSTQAVELIVSLYNFMSGYRGCRDVFASKKVFF